MPAHFSDEAWIKSESECYVGADGPDIASEYWFKSKPIDRDFCFRVTQLQLCTSSRDQGNADDKNAGSWTWFELVILANEDATEPKLSKEGNPLVWRSHSNRLANDTNPTLHFGAVFDRRSELLTALEVGDVLAVRVCSRFQGWINYADEGYVMARVLNEDLFTPHRWTLSSDVIPSLSEDVEDGSYSFMSTTPCFVQSTGSELASQIWFATPALDQDAIDRFEAIQLFTYARFQEMTTEPLGPDDSFSWFDLVILETPFDTVPRTENGVSLVWHSHSNGSSVISFTYGQQGKRFDLEEDEDETVRRRGEMIKGSLKPGNAIGVRVCAQYPAWENYAKTGQLVVRISNKAPQVEPIELPDVTAAIDAMTQIKAAAENYYSEIGYTSETIATLSNETRADIVLESPPAYEEPRPLRLLCLDGGGVRGVSELRILTRLMEEIALQEGGKGTPIRKPCEYFDMIVGTSTGGLIAMMLGRLRMTIAQCEEAYDKISRQVFGKRRRGWIGNEIGEKSAFVGFTYMYEEKPLEEAVKGIVKTVLGNSEATLAEPNPTCRVLVMSALASATEDAKTAVHLRNYDVGKTLPSSYTNFKIWEAARATSAAPIYFKRFEKDGKEFVDGGMGWNNPIFELVSELPAIFGTNFRIGALVSLGTGVPVLTQLRTAGITHVQDYIVVPTNSENPAHTFKKMAPILPRPGEEKYWRFNLDKASCKGYPFEYDGLMTKMDDCEAIGDIRKLTDLWLEDKSRTDSIVACARKLTSL